MVIILVQMGDILLTHSHVLINYYRHHAKLRQARRDPTLALTQSDLNKIHVGPKMEISTRYAGLLSTYFLCMTFNPGIPLLNFLACANFGLFYFVEKYLFINLYKAPHRFGSKLGHTATFMIPIGLIIHLAMSIWVYSNPSIFSSNTDTTDPSHVAYNTGTTVLGEGLVAYKINLNQTYPLFLYFILIITGIVFYFVFGRLKRHYVEFMQWFQGHSFDMDRRHKIAKTLGLGALVNGGFKRAVERNLVKDIASYSILKNPKYKEKFAISWNFAMTHRRVSEVRKSINFGNRKSSSEKRRLSVQNLNSAKSHSNSYKRSDTVNNFGVESSKLSNNKATDAGVDSNGYGVEMQTGSKSGKNIPAYITVPASVGAIPSVNHSRSRSHKDTHDDSYGYSIVSDTSNTTTAASSIISDSPDLPRTRVRNSLNSNHYAGDASREPEQMQQIDNNGSETRIGVRESSDNISISSTAAVLNRKTNNSNSSRSNKELTTQPRLRRETSQSSYDGSGLVLDEDDDDDVIKAETFRRTQQVALNQETDEERNTRLALHFLSRKSKDSVESGRIGLVSSTLGLGGLLSGSGHNSKGGGSRRPSGQSRGSGTGSRDSSGSPAAKEKQRPMNDMMGESFQTSTAVAGSVSGHSSRHRSLRGTPASRVSGKDDTSSSCNQSVSSVELAQQYYSNSNFHAIAPTSRNVSSKQGLPPSIETLPRKRPSFTELYFNDPQFHPNDLPLQLPSNSNSNRSSNSNSPSRLSSVNRGSRSATSSAPSPTEQGSAIVGISPSRIRTQSRGNSMSISGSLAMATDILNHSGSSSMNSSPSSSPTRPRPRPHSMNMVNNTSPSSENRRSSPTNNVRFVDVNVNELDQVSLPVAVAVSVESSTNYTVPDASTTSASNIAFPCVLPARRRKSNIM